MNGGLKLWQKALKVIPGGNGLLSKRPERYAPDLWPTYYESAKGCEIVDLDGNKFIDMAQMGIGTAILGYSDSEINEHVIESINKGVNTTLNTTEEPELAEILLEIDNFAGGVKFARSGAEAIQIAIRIARAYTKKEKILFSGYHGWSDWYLAANISSTSNLKSHLLDGLNPLGVPSGLNDTVRGFKYNDTRDFKQKIENNSDEIAAVIIEGARGELPTKEFIDEIQDFCKRNNSLLIIDEITSGWRSAYGGTYKNLNYIPDIVTYGKAMGNGFAISAVVGKQNVMDSAQDTFISSSFWTERVGFSAAIATLKKMKRLKTWEHTSYIGNYITKGTSKIATEVGLEISQASFTSLPSFSVISSKNKDLIDTLFIQEMLTKGYVASTSIYPSQCHTTQIVDEYLLCVKEAFQVIKTAIDNDTLINCLDTEPRSDSFKRLT